MCMYSAIGRYVLCMNCSCFELSDVQMSGIMPALTLFFYNLKSTDYFSRYAYIYANDQILLVIEKMYFYYKNSRLLS